MDDSSFCLGCGQPLVLTGDQRQSRRYCDDRCKMRFHRQQARRHAIPLTEAPMPWTQPVLHHGCFEDYTETCQGQIDVILTDPPYDRKALPVYAALAALAGDVLVPGGWCLVMTGWALAYEVWPLMQAVPDLEYITTVTYRMSTTRSKAVKWTTTGKRSWQERQKPILWWQKRARPQPGRRGMHPAMRRAGGSDCVEADVEGAGDLDQARYPDQQSLRGFQQILRKYSNSQDVILDPCLGWGTTVQAALSQQRPRVIGIEKDRLRYDRAVQAVTACLTPLVLPPYTRRSPS